MRYFISYGDLNFSESRERIRKEAEQLGLFDGVRIFSPADFTDEFRGNPVLKYRRGGGYWIWKPYIILKMLETVKDGYLVRYASAGCMLFPSHRWKTYFNVMAKYDLLAFKLDQICGCYTKKDVLELYYPFIGPYWGHYHQIAATFLVFKKSDFTVNLVHEWMITCTEKNVIDVSPECQEIQYKGFVEHRHDQSILSAIIYKYVDSCRIKISHHDFEGLRKGQAVLAARLNNDYFLHKHRKYSRRWYKFYISSRIRFVLENLV